MRANNAPHAEPQEAQEGAAAPSQLTNASLRPERDVQSPRSLIVAAILYAFALIAIGLAGLTTAFSQSSASPKVESIVNRPTSFAATPSTPKASTPPSPAARKAPNFYQPASPEPTPTPTNDVTGLARIATTYGREIMRGAAMILDSSGIIVTNYHIVNHPSPTFSVYIPEKGSTHFVRLIGYSSLIDVAILKVDGLPPLTPITSVVRPPAPGDPAAMFGFPDSESRAAAASGHVQTGVARNHGTMTIDNFTYDGMSFLASCHMVPEYSGGPTVNPKIGQTLDIDTRYYIDSKVQTESITISDAMRVKTEILDGKPTKDTVVK